MSVRPCHQIIHFFQCLPYIGIGFVLGEACVIEAAATKILRNEDVFHDNGHAMSQDFKDYILLSYGNLGVRAGVHGFLNIITAVVLTILGITGLGEGIILGLVGCAIVAFACYQTHQINQYLEQHPPTHALFVT